MAGDIYAAPRTVKDLKDCFFYHTMDVPGYGCIEGEWDLRPNMDRYLGGVDFRGKRVLDLGAAGGILSFHMEGKGAEVVSYDISEGQEWDVIPFARCDHRAIARGNTQITRKLNNAYWLAHRAHRSKAKVVYGSVYAVPGEIGPVDISVFGSILLHLRDPFLALQNALRLTREKVIIAEPIWAGGGLSGRRRLRRFDRVCTFLERKSGYRGYWLAKFLALEERLFNVPELTFLPNFGLCYPENSATWWQFSPEICGRFIKVLGFEKFEVNFHYQLAKGAHVPYFTLVGTRTREMR